ncbi:unnamed protein product, partial [Ilex paraguariensis]
MARGKSVRSKEMRIKGEDGEWCSSEDEIAQNDVSFFGKLYKFEAYVLDDALFDVIPKL